MGNWISNTINFKAKIFTYKDLEDVPAKKVSTLCLRKDKLISMVAKEL